MHIYEQLVELALAERESKNASVFLCVSVANGRPSAFLEETVEAGDENRDDFHCMQMSLLMRMLFNFGDD